MKSSKSYFWILSTLFLLAPIGIYLWARQSGHFGYVYGWAQTYYPLFIISLIVLKIMGIVYPPLPGGIFTLGAIPFIGWVSAYLVDLTGSVIGSIMAYYIGGKYGNKILTKLFDDNTLEKLQKIKIKSNRELESIIVLRLLGNSVVELVAYGAGLLGLKPRNFLVGTIVSHALYGIPAYWLAQNIFSSQNAVVSIGLFLVSGFILWKLKGRYLE